MRGKSSVGEEWSTGAAGRSGESIRDFEMNKEEKGRSCWITQVFWCSQFQL